MPEGIVDDFEAIAIEKENGKPIAGLEFDAIEQLDEPIEQKGSIGQTGEAIV